MTCSARSNATVSRSSGSEAAAASSSLGGNWNRLQIFVVMVWKPAGSARMAGEPNSVIDCRKATSAPASSAGMASGMVTRRAVVQVRPPRIEDASSILGGRTWTTARRVTIPLAMPALLAGALVAFLQSMTLFGSPAILALPAGFHTITTKIWSLFQFPPKPELAAAASLPLLLLTVGLLRAQAKILGRRGYAVVGGKSGIVRPVPLGGWKWLALALCLAVLCLSVFLPYAALFNAAFARIPSQPLTLATFTLSHFRFVFQE